MVVNAVVEVDADHPEADADQRGDDGQAGRDQRAEGDDQHEQGDAYSEQLALAAGLGHGLHPGAVDLGCQPVVTRCVQRVQHLGLGGGLDVGHGLHVEGPGDGAHASVLAQRQQRPGVRLRGGLGRPRLLGARDGPLVLRVGRRHGVGQRPSVGICGTDWRSAIRSSTLSA